MMIRAGLVLAMAMGAVVYPPPVKAQSFVAVAVEGPQVRDDLFAGTEKFSKGAKESTEVNLDQNMLKMVNKGDSDTAHKLDFIIVRSYEYDKPGMYRMEDFEVYRQKLMDGSWSCSIHIKEKDGSTDICSRSNDKGETSEMVLMTAEPRELTFIHMRGHGLSFEDLGKMGGMGHGQRLPAPVAPAHAAPAAPAAARSASAAPAAPQ